MNGIAKLGLFCSMFCACFTVSYAQNLIPDSGFELWDGSVGNPPNTMAPLTHWYNANGTPDHHHQLNPSGNNLTSLDPCPTGSGDTWCGYPYQGQAVLGCYKGNGPDGVKEWAGTQMTEPMIPGDCYKVSFWIQSKYDDPAFLMETNQWGIFFSTTPMPSFNPNLANFAPMANRWLACPQVINGAEWQYVEFDYIASGAYQYAFVGYMGNVATSTFTAWSNDYLVGFYAWFDEVKVEHINPTLQLNDDASICLGDSVLLNFESNYPITWTNGVNSGNTTQFWATPEQTTTYYVQTQGAAACNITDSVTITVLGASETTMQALVCTNAEPFVLQSGSSLTGPWAGPGIVNPATGLFDPSVVGPGNWQVYFASPADCAERFFLNIAIQPPPVIGIEASALQGCPPLMVNFTGLNPLNAGDYTWRIGNQDIAADTLPISFTFESAGEYDIQLSVYYSDFCTATVSRENLIQVYEPPVAAFDYSPDSPSNKMPEVLFEDTSLGDVYQWHWDFGDGSGDNTPNPRYIYAAPGIYEVVLAVEAAGQCRDTIRQTLTVENVVSLYVPNAFSPNSDGINDKFEINASGPIQNFELSIYDRWGGMIFRSNSLDQQWDGRSANGAQATVGIYTYVIDYQYSNALPDQIKATRLAGDVLLLR